MKRPVKISFLFLILIFLMLSCSELNKLGEGALKGKITIGPLCPVETIPPQPQCLPTADTYKAWQTSVWNLSKTKLMLDIKPELNGNYFIKIPVGEYLIDFREMNITRIGGNNLPVKIKITTSDTTRVDINIDTGIR
jgi:hypothetical protein